MIALPLAAAEHPAAVSTKDDLVSRGQYLSVAADCAACHTDPAGGQPFAGGYAIQSPMGKIFSTNITPSKQFGIGNYSRDEFAKAVREGVRADGGHLYPAMPYASYSMLTDADIDALYAYFMKAVKPVEKASPETKLPFPFNVRASMIGWNALFLGKDRFTADKAKDDQWNRGKYLVEGLAHCAECHTPRNALMAPNQSAAFAGGQVGSWYAPNITSDKLSGIGGWTDEELFSYLKTGKAGDKSRAAGPMAEAVEHSFQHLSDDDIKAMVAYLRTVPAIRDAGQTEANFVHGTAGTDVLKLRGVRKLTHEITDMSDGAQLYIAACASCHQPDGLGTKDKFYPALVNNTTTGQPNPTDLIAAILFGVKREVGGRETLMPGFGADSLVQRLSDEQVAAIANHVLQQFGNKQAKVTPADVATVRAGGPTPLIAWLANPFVLGVIGLVGLGVIVAAFRFIRRRKQAR
ncbi:cytochrome c [Sphingomonas oleivorans]|uniref:cytochrome c n=1 Tax=Sphingomonas oleivorans TaxID=1735121 RepID=UPI001A9DFB17|nr:cytochrome c [Sphingomonas oleivorans]